MAFRRRSDEQRKAMFARMKNAISRVSPKNRRELARSALTAGIGAGIAVGGVYLMRRHPAGFRVAAGGAALGAAAGGNLYEDIKRAAAQVKESGREKAAVAAARGYAVKRKAGEAARTIGGKAAERGTESVINWAGTVAEDALRRKIHESTARIEGNLARLAGSARVIATENALRRIQTGREHVAVAMKQPLSHDEVKAFREAQQEILNRLKLLEQRRELAKRLTRDERSATEMLKNIVKAKGYGHTIRAMHGDVDPQDLDAVRKAHPWLNATDKQEELLKKVGRDIRAEGR